MAYKVWARNDTCLAYCSVDGDYHPAVIRRICKDDGKVMVEVHYEDYNSQENEILHLNQIREVPGPYSDQEDDVIRSSERPQTPTHSHVIFNSDTNKQDSPLKRRLASCQAMDSSDNCRLERASRLILDGVLTEQEIMEKTGTIIKNDDTEKKNRLAGRIEDVDSPIRDQSSTQSDTENVNKSEIFGPIEGFSSYDLEKPIFSFTAPGPKVPYILNKDPLIQVPASINQYLRTYQREGISFLYNNYKQDRGGLLLDDMGLGKTVQVIGFLSAIFGKTGTSRDLIKHRPEFIRKLSAEETGIAVDQPGCEDGPRPQWLIVCPGTVLYNWSEELETWGYFSVGRFHQIQKERTLSDALRGKLELVLTTFETLRENIVELNRIKWDGCIVDEVHKIKERNAQVTKAMNEIQTVRRYGLTGTALQNNMMELWCLLDWANRGCLGEKSEFDERFARIIERGQRYESSKRELAEARRMKEEFSNLTKEMLIRRMKTLIADQLPKKHDKIVYCRLSTLQRDVYRAILDHPEMGLVLNRDMRCGCGSRRPQKICCKKTNKYGDSIKSITFSFMHLLLKAANHPALLLSERTPSTRQQRLCDNVLSTAFAGYDDYVRDCEERAVETLSDPQQCGKMEVLRGLLKVFKKEEAKILLFSYSTKTLDILEHYIVTSGYEYCRLDGNVSEKRRQQLVRQFNKDPHLFICLISTKAGGIGLNLTGANVVIIYDPNWNPTHDLQAQDRAYRIGQQRDVRVYRLITTGTIEENIYLRQIYKQQLANVAVSSENARRYFTAVQGDTNQKGELFGLENMFRLRDERECLTEKILQRYEVTETKLAGHDVTDYVTPQPIERTNFDLGATDVGADNDDNDDDDDDDSVGSSVESSDFFSSDSETESPSNKKRRRLAEKVGTENPQPSTSTGRTRSSPQAGKQRKTTRRQKIVNEWRREESYDSVSQVFDKCGVVHVHANRDVVGSSRAEDHMTKCAIRDVYDRRENSQEFADECEVMEKMQKSPVREKGPRAMVVNGRKLLIGQTPKAITSQHFSAMAVWCDVTESELARQIVEMTSLQRLDLLVEFYQAEGLNMNGVFYVARPSSGKDSLKRQKPVVRVGDQKIVRRSVKHHPILGKDDGSLSTTNHDSIDYNQYSDSYSQDGNSDCPENRDVIIDASLPPENSNFIDELLDELLGTGVEPVRKKISTKRKLLNISSGRCGSSPTSLSKETPDFASEKNEILDTLLGIGDATRRKKASKRRTSGHSSPSCGISDTSTPNEINDVQLPSCDDNDILEVIFNVNSKVRKSAPKRKT